MTENILQTLQRLGRSDLREDEYVSLGVSFRRPIGFGYEIGGFLGDKKLMESAAFQRKLSALGGVHSNYSYEMLGEIKYPGEFAGRHCQLLVNGCAPSEYIEYANNGRVGDGWIEADHILFRLYIAPRQAKDLLEHRWLASVIQPELDPEPNGLEATAWINMKLHIANYRQWTLKRDGHPMIGFDIVRIYC